MSDETEHLSPQEQERLYLKIYAVVRQIPAGKVATYGQVATIVGNCTARMVGYAMAALHAGSDVPWQRVVNAQGKISLRGDGGGAVLQRQLLEEEGIRFDAQNRINLREARWYGPDIEWLEANGFSLFAGWTSDDERR